jgi:hypothetical protein
MNDPHEGVSRRKTLDAMLHARQSMHACMTILDAAIYNPKDRTRTENRLDRVIVEAIAALRRLHTLRHGQNSGVP